MSVNNYDIIIIGSGPSGYNAAVRASQIGAKVALIEKSLVGGVCLNHGCIPTKFLWTVLKRKIEIKKAYEYALNVNISPINFKNIVKIKNKNIDNIRKGMIKVILSYNIDLIYATASLINKNTIMIVENDKRLTYELHAEKIIIATGTQPKPLTDLLIYDGSKIINSNDILNIDELPNNMLIIGGGPIGIEMATIFSGFGCNVTLLEYENYLLSKEDIEISESIKKNLMRQGVTVINNCYNKIDQEVSKKKYDKILVTVGRQPNNNLKLENIGIKINKLGFIEVDEFCQTNIKNIYAVGDITGKHLLAYTAQNDGIIAAINAVTGNCVTIDNSIIPLVVFSMPQSASVKISGFSQYKDVSLGKFPFTASVRAILDSERIGFVKCAVDKFSKKPLAFWIFGEHADEIINVASQILKSGIKHIQRETIFHPSLSETLLNAYEDAFSKCTELTKKINKIEVQQ
ncbi:MAG: NAD(P)/FAD-dependent oxidoreductase [Endomicrobium sp.]|jgi:dihydrolipoamide dehydrogenase|nr:NAD(P)/FAD-dependent oxidoreductase [Endomicrobium sp.]